MVPGGLPSGGDRIHRPKEFPFGMTEYSINIGEAGRVIPGEHTSAQSALLIV